MGQKARMSEPTQTAQPDEGRLLTAAELAALMRVSVSWVWAHGKDLPFAVKTLPGQKRVSRYSYAGFRKWQERPAR